MSDYRGPDHTVTVTAYPYRCYDADSKTWSDVVDIEHDIEHPAECDALKYGELCALDRWVNEIGYEDAGMPMEPGVYHLSYWGTGPDYNGEYDCGLDVEAIDAEAEAAKAGA